MKLIFLSTVLILGANAWGKDSYISPKYEWTPKEFHSENYQPQSIDESLQFKVQTKEDAQRSTASDEDKKNIKDNSEKSPKEEKLKEEKSRQTASEGNKGKNSKVEMWKYEPSD